MKRYVVSYTVTSTNLGAEDLARVIDLVQTVLGVPLRLNQLFEAEGVTLRKGSRVITVAINEYEQQNPDIVESQNADKHRL